MTEKLRAAIEKANRGENKSVVKLVGTCTRDELGPITKSILNKREAELKQFASQCNLS